MSTRAERAALKHLQALADKLTPAVRKQIQQALDAVQENASLAEIERALRTSNAFVLHDLAALLPLKLQGSVTLLQQLFKQGAEIGKFLTPGGSRIGIRFDSTNPFAQAAAKKSAAEFVTGITQQTRLAIRNMVVRGFAEGIAPRDLAQLIKPVIGLTDRQALSVARLKQQWTAEGFSRSEVTRRVNIISNRLRRQRAEVIARTEVIRASNDGQMLAWAEAVGKGLLNARSQKVWLTTPDDRLCRYCRAVDGQTVTLGMPFRTPLGRVQGPPMHPLCRCAIFVVPVKQGVRKAA